MAAVDEEAPGLDRGEFAADMGHPVGLGDFRDDEGLRARGGRQQRQRDLVGGLGEPGADFPAVAAVLDLEDAGADGFGVEVLAGLGQRLCGSAALGLGQRGPGRGVVVARVVGAVLGLGHHAAPPAPATTELPPDEDGDGSGLPSPSPVTASCTAAALDACTPVPRRPQ